MKIYYCALANNTEIDVIEKLLINKYAPQFNKKDKHQERTNIVFNEPEWTLYDKEIKKVASRKTRNNIGKIYFPAKLREQIGDKIQKCILYDIDLAIIKSTILDKINDNFYQIKNNGMTTIQLSVDECIILTYEKAIRSLLFAFLYKDALGVNIGNNYLLDVNNMTLGVKWRDVNVETAYFCATNDLSPVTNFSSEQVLPIIVKNKSKIIKYYKNRRANMISTINSEINKFNNSIKNNMLIKIEDLYLNTVHEYIEYMDDIDLYYGKNCDMAKSIIYFLRNLPIESKYIYNKQIKSNIKKISHGLIV